jgi:D-3-phosphoglycerate dehydrogenase
VDWDSTLCSEETLDFVAAMVLDDEALARFRGLTDGGMGGDLPFDESLVQRFALLRATRGHIEEAARLLVARLDESAVARRDVIAANRDRIHVVSGGFEELIAPSLSVLGIRPDHVHANRFLYDEAGFVIGADPDRLTSRDDGKAAQVATLGLDGLRVVVGDGINDYRIKELGHADIFVAYTGHQRRENVVAMADAAADSFAAPLLN